MLSKTSMAYMPQRPAKVCIQPTVVNPLILASGVLETVRVTRSVCTTDVGPPRARWPIAAGPFHAAG